MRCFVSLLTVFVWGAAFVAANTDTQLHARMANPPRLLDQDRRSTNTSNCLDNQISCGVGCIPDTASCCGSTGQWCPTGTCFQDDMGTYRCNNSNDDDFCDQSGSASFTEGRFSGSSPIKYSPKKYKPGKLGSGFGDSGSDCDGDADNGSGPGVITPALRIIGVIAGAAFMVPRLI